MTYCSIDKCKKNSYHVGMCSMHYQRKRKYGDALYPVTTKVFHHLTKDPLYGTWINMKSRCNNPNDSSYINYGRRGIKVCKRWLHNFDNFKKDMGEKPINTSLDRINNSKGYSKQNCRWATQQVQSINTRNRKCSSGVRGVNWCHGKWVAKITVNYKTFHLGVFTTIEEASEIRKKAEEKYFKPLLDRVQKYQ